MSERRRSYAADDIEVTFDPKRCIHSERCVRGLPTVFDAERRPWVDPSRADAGKVAEVVASCPTGALKYRRLDGGDPEPVPAENELRVSPDGPVYARGDLRIELRDGELVRETRAAFCRCGASKIKPFCDDSHKEISFGAPGTLGDGRLVPGDAEHTWLRVEVVPGGPLVLRGPATVKPAGGGEPAVGVKGSLCRCGGSQAKPFCDGTHRKIGFDQDDA